MERYLWQRLYLCRFSLLQMEMLGFNSCTPIGRPWNLICTVFLLETMWHQIIQSSQLALGDMESFCGKRRWNILQHIDIRHIYSVPGGDKQYLICKGITLPSLFLFGKNRHNIQYKLSCEGPPLSTPAGNLLFLLCKNSMVSGYYSASCRKFYWWPSNIHTFSTVRPNGIA